MTDQPANDPRPPEPLRCRGVARDRDCPAPGGAVAVYFDRLLTDDELRDFQDACQRFAANGPRFQ